MKKYIFTLLLLIVSLALTPFSYEINANDESELCIETYYPEDVLDYADLSNTKYFSLNDNYIAYTLHKTTDCQLAIFNKSNKTTSIINGFLDIELVKFVNDKILIVDNSKIYIVDNFSKTQVSDLSILIDGMPDIKAIDIYSTNTKTYIGYIYNDTFELLEYSNLIHNATIDNKKTFTSGYYLNAYMLALNSTKAYIVYYTTPPSQNGVCIQNYTEDTPNVKDSFVVYAQLIDTFYHDGNEYIVTFTNELLLLLNNQFEVLHDIKIGTDIDIENNIFPILSISDFDYYNDTLYLCDTHYKTIQSFKINIEEDTTLKSDNILLCGNNQAKGRFNNVDNIFIQGDTIFTADTNNNRIQVLTHSKSSIINMPENIINPTSICRDGNNIIYVVAKVDDKNNNEDDDQYRILKYQFVNNDYILSKTVTPAKSNCHISSITIVNDVVYALDYENNEIIYVNGDTTSFKCKFLNTENYITDLLKDSKIMYLKKVNNFVIQNENKLSLHDITGSMINEITITDCKDISMGLSEIYLLSNNKISLINIIDNILVLSDKYVTSNALSQMTTITYDIVNSKMYVFNNIRSCIEYFDCNLIPNPFVFSDYKTYDYTTIDNTPYILELTYDPLIYTHPYSLGNFYNIDSSIENAIAVESYDDYYRIIFNIENKLHEGFVLKNKCTKLEYSYNVTKVITINQFVPVYKYPTLLKTNNKAITCDTLPIYSKVTLTHTCPASIDGKTFYMFKVGNEVGFLYSQDIILDSSKNITNLNTENASLNLIDKKEIYLYAEDKTTAIYSLKDNDRIYVEEYDKDSEYTKIIYKDESSKSYEGYIETKYIVMDKLDSSKIILISLIVLSIVILVVIFVVYISIKKKK